MLRHLFKLLFVFLIFPFGLYSQCGPATPTFTVNLTGNPGGTWISPNVVRNDVCCGQSGVTCIKFIITLDPAAAGMSFNIASGAIPGGALFYQINCGPQTALGAPICLSGVGPHVLTFCKPGNNANTYEIASIPAAVGGPDIVINDGCTKVLTTAGFNPSTVTWTSVFPGSPGAYNSYLSCTSGCTTPSVTASGAAPAYVDYMVCGQAAANCNTVTICDTIRVNFNPTLAVSIMPANPTICFGQTSTTLTAQGSGGTLPYSYLWNNVTPTQTVSVGAGTHNITLSDASGCPPVFNSVTVTSFSVPITANAGTDQVKCIQSPLATLNGTVTGASGGIWAGGTGTFSPNNTTLSNITYSPTAAELAAGSVNLYLTTTGNGTCPRQTDTVKISYLNFEGAATASVSNVSCFGGNNGTATVNLSGGSAPYSYLWNTATTQTASTAVNLPVGTYSVTITDAIGCTSQMTVAITQPPILAASGTVTNVSCFGTNTGSIVIAPAGGTMPYIYSWNPGGQTTASVTGLPAGNYSVTVSDANNCQRSYTYAVTQPLPLSITSTQTNVSCFNGSNGVASASVTGGTFPYTYSWSPGGSTAPTAAGLQAGTYTFTASDFFNCTAAQTVVVTQPPLLSLATAVANETCHYLNNGSASAIASGGTPGYTYAWLPGGQTTSSVANQPAGTYSVTLTDSKGCSSSAMAVIGEPPPLAVGFINQISVGCFGGSTGSIGASPTGGTPNYTYLWSPGASTNASLSNIPAGTYTVTVTDNNSCIVSNSVTITQPPALNVSTSSGSVSCNGGSNGSASALASGGTMPYTYQWTPGGAGTPALSGIPSGVYTVTTTDFMGCMVTSTVFVNQPAPLLPVTTSTNSTCGNANGIGSVSVSGGIAPYTYQWLPAGGTNSVTPGLASGVYSVIVTDANTCSQAQVLIINDTGGPNATIFSTTNVSCFGGNNGSASASISGGVGPYTYTWSPSGGNSPVATGLTAGTYYITVKDDNGCIFSTVTGAVITQPTAVSGIVTASNVSCFAGSNGSATVTPGGGTPGYTFSWLPGAATGSVVAGLSSGAYSVQITDANNCTGVIPFSISQPTAALNAATSSSAASCFGLSNGSATVSVTGGTALYSYNWLPMNVNNPVISGLAAGTYTVHVTDAKNCLTSATVSVSQPLQPLSASANSMPPACAGGSNGTATITPSGGTAGYTYQWTPTGGTWQTASGLAAGNYVAVVTDANNCQTNVFLNVPSPTAVTASLAVIHPACGLPNGSITSQVSGGTGAYTYTWAPVNVNTPNAAGLSPGTYTFTTADAFGCIKTLTTTLANINGASLAVTSVTNTSCFGANDGAAAISITQGTLPYTISWLPFGGNAATAGQLTAGVYTANVTDGRGCLSSVTATITEPAPVSVAINTIVNVSCFNGSNGLISVTASGGTPSYSYSWAPSGTGATLNNLSAGTYTVFVKDSRLCSAAISMNVTHPAPLTSTITGSSNPVCFNGTGNASVFVAGGTAPYTYTWTSNPSQSGSTASGLTSGTYTVLIRDAKGCQTASSVTLTQPLQVITTAGLNDTICINQSGMVTANATGGQGGYTYAWQPSGVVNSGTLVINPATVTTNYTVVAFDANGCAGTADTVRAVVYNLTGANINAAGLTPICPGQATTIYATATGITGPLSYVWNNGLGNGPGAFVTTPAQPSTYVVTVTNACGASVKDSISIAFNPPPTVAIALNGTLICVPGSIQFFDNSITGNSADPINSWSWNFGDGTTSSLPNPTHTYYTPGTYSVSLSVRTGGGCTNNNASAPVVVNAYPPPNAAFAVNSTLLNIPYDVLNCQNQSTGAVSYSWNFGDGGSSALTNPNHTYTSVGNFQVQLVATSVHGCTDTAYVSVITDADVVFPNAFTPNASGPSGGYYVPGSLDNDIFFPYTSGVVDYKFQVFNRWGELIFETEDIKQGWDGYYRGNICQVGVYIWKAYVKLNNSKVFNKTGDVTLLR